MTTPHLVPSSDSDQLSESALIQNRKKKVQELKESGINPYPATSPFIQDRIPTSKIKEQFDSIQTGEESKEIVKLCGRLMTRREMGKAAFAHLQDFDGQLQIYVRKDLLGEKNYDVFCKHFDLGDILGVKGKVFRTKTGELSIRVEEMTLLSKSLRPLPEKWHGLKDIETRARQRELDLIANVESKKVFLIRSQIVQSLRTILQEKGYIEVETPIMQSVPGGAIAKPFETYHNALGQKFFLRVAPELYLKRCLVGGLEKVFEIGRVFRNEGIDSLHNPEFTILEAYESYGNMETMMRLTEDLITETAKKIGLEKLEIEGQTILTERPFKRRTVVELFKEFVGESESKDVEEGNWKSLAERRGQNPESGLVHKVFDHLFDDKIAPHLVQPTFVTEFPSEFSPLAKRKEESEKIAERFELYIAGEEIANAYSELNNPEEQRNRLEQYRQSRTAPSAQDESEGMGYDESFLTALEYGMPPAGGLGIGVDRLVMLFSHQNSIRDVLLFPTLRSEK